jgi:hypothetical protein
MALKLNWQKDSLYTPFGDYCIHEPNHHFRMDRRDCYLLRSFTDDRGIACLTKESAKEEAEKQYLDLLEDAFQDDGVKEHFVDWLAKTANVKPELNLSISLDKNYKIDLDLNTENLEKFLEVLDEVLRVLHVRLTILRKQGRFNQEALETEHYLEKFQLLNKQIKELKSLLEGMQP